MEEHEEYHATGRLTDVVLSQRGVLLLRFLREDVVEVDAVGVLK